jgi:hypothetical protein
MWRALFCERKSTGPLYNSCVRRHRRPKMRASIGQQLGRKSVRKHQRFGAAVGGRGEQLKGAADVRVLSVCELVRAGLASAHAGRMVADGRLMEVATQ